MSLSVAAHAAGCADVTIGESLLSDCSDHIDNDGDQLYDCDDPDCQVFEHCRLPAHPLLVDAAVGPLGGAIAPGVDAGLPIGGSGGSAVPPPPLGADEDAGVTPAAQCGPCATNEECIDGECKSVLALDSGRFALTITRATLPEKDITEACYDPCGALPLQFVACLCLPDPYVKIYRVTATGEELVGMTSVAPETLDASYASESFEIELAAGDAIRFEVWDDDDPDNDDRIYPCRPDLSNLDQGMIHCEKLVGSVLAGLLFGVDATLTRL